MVPFYGQFIPGVFDLLQTSPRPLCEFGIRREYARDPVQCVREQRLAHWPPYTIANTPRLRILIPPEHPLRPPVNRIIRQLEVPLSQGLTQLPTSNRLSPLHPRDHKFQPSLAGPQRRRRAQAVRDRPHAVDRLPRRRRQQHHDVGQRHRGDPAEPRHARARVDQQHVGRPGLLDPRVQIEHRLEQPDVPARAGLRFELAELRPILARRRRTGREQTQPAALVSRNRNLDGRCPQLVEGRELPGEAAREQPHGADLDALLVNAELVVQPRRLEVEVERDDLATSQREKPRRVDQQQRAANAAFVRVKRDGLHHEARRAPGNTWSVAARLAFQVSTLPMRSLCSSSSIRLVRGDAGRGATNCPR